MASILQGCLHQLPKLGLFPMNTLGRPLALKFLGRHDNCDVNRQIIGQSLRLPAHPLNALFQAGQVPISLPHVAYSHSKSSPGCENSPHYDTFLYKRCRIRDISEDLIHHGTVHDISRAESALDAVFHSHSHLWMGRMCETGFRNPPLPC